MGERVTFESRLKPVKRRQVIQLYREGKKVPEIMEATGVARSTIYWLLREEGVQTRKKSGPKPDERVIFGNTEAVAALERVVAEQQARILAQEREIGRLKERLKAGGMSQR
jgi:transposase